MNRKENIKTTLVIAFFCLALGGWLLHIRIHPFSRNIAYLIPFLSGLMSVFFLPVLFCFRPTITLAYILNGFLAIIGTITMTQLSIAHFDGPATINNLIMNTLFADIVILWGKFALGKALFDLDRLKSDTETTSKGRFFRYPKMGWWWVHLAGLSIIYALGNIIWKRG